MGTLTIKRGDTQAVLSTEIRESPPLAIYNGTTITSNFYGEKVFKCGIDESNPNGKHMATDLQIGGKTLSCANDRMLYDIVADYQRGFVQGIQSVWATDKVSLSPISFAGDVAFLKGSTNSSNVYSLNKDGTLTQITSGISSGAGYTSPYVGRTTNRAFVMLGRRGNTTGAKGACSWDEDGTRITSSTDVDNHHFNTKFVWNSDGGTLGDGEYAIALGGYTNPSQSTPSTATATSIAYSEDMTWTTFSSGVGSLANLMCVECADGSITYANGHRNGTYYDGAGKVDEDLTVTVLPSWGAHYSNGSKSMSIGGKAGYIYSSYLEMYSEDGTLTEYTPYQPYTDFYKTNSHGDVCKEYELITGIYVNSTVGVSQTIWALDDDITVSEIEPTIIENANRAYNAVHFGADRDELMFIGGNSSSTGNWLKVSVKYV